MLDLVVIQKTDFSEAGPSSACSSYSEAGKVSAAEGSEAANAVGRPNTKSKGRRSTLVVSAVSVRK